MPLFKPFKGIRAKSANVQNFVSKPIEKLSKEDVEKELSENSYVEMIKPYLYAEPKNLTESMLEIRKSFEKMLDDRDLHRDQSSIYLYVQCFPDKTEYRGLLGLTSTQDYEEGKIKAHEDTIAKRVEDYASYIDKVEFQAAPILLTYPSSSKLEVLMDIEEKRIPVINFTDKMGVTHKVWRIDNRLTIKQFKDVFNAMDSFYIADGHHRLSSLALNAENQRKKDKHPTGMEGYNYILSFLISNNSIKIYDYNRLVKDLNGLSNEQFLAKLEKDFIVNEKGSQPYYPTQRNHLGMYLDGKFYSLHVKHEQRSLNGGLEGLDHYFLEERVFKDILGLTLTKNNDKIAYINGDATPSGLSDITKMVDSGQYKVGFAVYPVSFSELVKISDLGQTMPPKCTYIEPKLLSGLLIYDMQ